MKKYGLQLRVPPQQKRNPARPPLPAPLAFNNDDDDDNVEREILRQAHRNKTHKDIEDQHKKALEEDPSVFDYDGVYDKMKEKQVRPVELDRKDRKPRYIQGLMDKAKQREREHEVIYERKLAKERSKDEDMYADKDKFVTSAYKKKLAEQAKWLEEERLREMREEKDDVTKKTDITDFYFNLGKNVAFGAREAESRKAVQPKEDVVLPSGQVTSHPAISIIEKKNQDDDDDDDDDDDNEYPPEGKSDSPNATPASETSSQDKVKNEPSASIQSITPDDDQKKIDEVAKDHHKRSEDAIAMAKARFLARKKAKV